jgi:hypothetical protein
MRRQFTIHLRLKTANQANLDLIVVDVCGDDTMAWTKPSISVQWPGIFGN